MEITDVRAEAPCSLEFFVCSTEACEEKKSRVPLLC